jgi:hypothetical protein
VFPGTLPRPVQRALLGSGRPGPWSVGRLIVCRRLQRTQVKSSQVKSRAHSRFDDVAGAHCDDPCRLLDFPFSWEVTRGAKGSSRVATLGE